jgi:hypothetical protein
MALNTFVKVCITFAIQIFELASIVLPIVGCLEALCYGLNGSTYKMVACTGKFEWWSLY